MVWNTCLAELCEHCPQWRNRNPFLSSNSDDLFLKDPTNPFLVETKSNRKIANVASCCNTMIGIDICRLGFRFEPA